MLTSAYIRGNKNKDMKNTTLYTQGIKLTNGDEFYVGQDTAIYTFSHTEWNDKYDFLQLYCSSEYDSNVRGTFRIEFMENEGLFIRKK